MDITPRSNTVGGCPKTSAEGQSLESRQERTGGRQRGYCWMLTQEGDEHRCKYKGSNKDFFEGRSTMEVRE